MKIERTYIENAIMGLDDQKRLLVQIKIHEERGPIVIEFNLINPVAVENLTKFMDLIDAETIGEMERRVIRIATLNNSLKAIGNWYKDKFIDITCTISDSFEELSQAELLERYPDKE